MPNPTTPEKYLVAKELADALREQGIVLSVSYARSIIRDCSHAARRQLRLSDAIAFLRDNPGYKPRARRRCGVQ